MCSPFMYCIRFLVHKNTDAVFLTVVWIIRILLLPLLSRPPPLLVVLPLGLPAPRHAAQLGLAVDEAVPVHVERGPVLPAAVRHPASNSLVQISEHHLPRKDVISQFIHTHISTQTFLSCFRSLPVNSVRISRKARFGGAPVGSSGFSRGFTENRMLK